MRQKFLSVTTFIVCIVFIAGLVAISCSKEDAIGTPDGTEHVLKATSCGQASNGYYYCCNGSSSDPDGDGWGWENSASCIVKGSKADPGGSSSSSSSSSSGGSCPSSLSCPSGISCGCYTVSGLGSTKQTLRNAGASQYFLASAMMETEGMNTNYTYGDGKSGDSFNAGRCKMNYYAARLAGVGRGSTSAFWNYCTSASGDVSTWNTIKSYWGSKYWAVHRNGQSGANNPNTTDINNFKAANDWTNNQLGSHLTDNVRFWCSIPAI